MEAVFINYITMILFFILCGKKHFFHIYIHVVLSNIFYQTVKCTYIYYINIYMLKLEAKRKPFSAQHKQNTEKSMYMQGKTQTNSITHLEKNISNYHVEHCNELLCSVCVFVCV